MDGVLVREEDPIPGAKEFIAALRENDVPFLVLTNNSTVTGTGAALISFSGGLSTGGGDFTATALAGDVLVGTGTMTTSGGDMTLSAGGGVAVDFTAGSLNLGGGALHVTANTTGAVDGGTPAFADDVSFSGTVTAGITETPLSGGLVKVEVLTGGAARFYQLSISQ